jgi:hypothetical protein
MLTLQRSSHCLVHCLEVPAALDVTGEACATAALHVAWRIIASTVIAAVATAVEHVVEPCQLCTDTVCACSVTACACSVRACTFSVTQHSKACRNVLAMTATLVLMSGSIYAHTRRNLYTHTHERYDNHTVLIQPADLL